MFSILLALTLTAHADTLKITSPDFNVYGEIALRCSCDGNEQSPEIHIDGIPKGTKSLILIMEDLDVAANHFTNWIVYNIPPQTLIKANSIPGTQAMNSLGKFNYMGPCPPGGSHRYSVKVFALNTLIHKNEEMNRTILEQEIKGHILMEGQLNGLYSRISAVTSGVSELEMERP